MSEAPERLRLLADWFDVKYSDAGTSDEVQRDLRRFANEYESQQAKIERLKQLCQNLYAELRTYLPRWVRADYLRKYPWLEENR